MPSNPALSKFVAMGSINARGHVLRPETLMAVAKCGVDESMVSMMPPGESQISNLRSHIA